MPTSRLRRISAEGWRIIAQGVLAGCAITTLVMVCIGVVVLLGNSSQARVQRDAQAQTLRTQAQALRLLIECTTPPLLRNPPERHVKPTDCFVRQQAATADFTAANGPLSPLLSAAAACGAVHPGDIKATRACVVEGIKP